MFKTSAKYSYLFIIISLFVSTAMFAETHAPSTENHNKEGIAEVVEEEVDIVETILHHVSDANENHLGSIGHKHISIPLPCILINKETKKLTFVMSSAFHKTHEIDGYKLEHGRVVDAQTGKRDTFYDLSITKNVFNMMIAFIILTIIFYSIKGAYAKRKGQAPKGLQSFFEPIIVFLVNEVAKPNIDKI
ncbi:MAG: hypothetical protein IPK18_05655 [Sphingobacteriales bacterium]|nr:MAG: hypothetical protein IPK18_05655 [Sphingobacteriales bacterium]